jgi:hypothetical protein
MSACYTFTIQLVVAEIPEDWRAMVFAKLKKFILGKYQTDC